jgi:hypothetical protein
MEQPAQNDQQENLDVSDDKDVVDHSDSEYDEEQMNFRVELNIVRL